MGGGVTLAVVLLVHYLLSRIIQARLDNMEV